MQRAANASSLSWIVYYLHYGRRSEEGMTSGPNAGKMARLVGGWVTDNFKINEFRSMKTKSSSIATFPRNADMAKLEASAIRASTLLKAMANPVRLMVLCQIAQGEKSVSELEQTVELGQSALSQHLAVLRAKHLVTTRRVGQTIFYSLASPEAASVMGTLYEVFCRKTERRASARAKAKAA